MAARGRQLQQQRRTGAPFLRHITHLPEQFDGTRHPFDVRAFAHGIDLRLDAKITRDFLNSPERFFMHLFESAVVPDEPATIDP